MATSSSLVGVVCLAGLAACAARDEGRAQTDAQPAADSAPAADVAPASVEGGAPSMPADAGGGGAASKDVAAGPADGAAAAPDGKAAATDAAVPPADAAAERCLGGCAAYGTPTQSGRVQVAALSALSGAAASWRNPGVIFAHNDRGSVDVYALSGAGAPLGRFTFAGVRTTDVEDMAVGPCPSGTCLFLADIGDNDSARSDCAILRAPEPEVVAAGAAVDLTAERFTFRYADGPHNAEGLLVEPRTGALYVVTKVAAGQPSAVYKLPHPLRADVTNVATKLADLPVPRAGGSPVTSASAHPCGLGFLLRTSESVYEFRVAPGAPFESAFAAPPALVASGTEPQSEAVSYLPDGRGFVSSGEGPSAPIFASTCR